MTAHAAVDELNIALTTALESSSSTTSSGTGVQFTTI